MKKVLVLGLLALFSFSLLSSVANASVRVKGYTTKRGTYVAPSHRSSPDRVKYNNYSSKGNSNPYTGKKGYAN